MAGSTIVFFPEGAYGPTNNCVGIGQVLRERGHRVVFVIEESFAGGLEATLVYLTLVVPEIVIAVASLIFFSQAHDRTAVFPALGWKTILLAHLVFNVSLVMLIVRARFVGMGSTLEEASFDLGAGPLSTFRQVTLPRLFPAILAGALLAFTFSFDDYVLSVFTAGSTTQTWPMVIFAAVRFGVTPAINALATMMLGVTVLLIIVTGIVLRRGARTSGTTDGAGVGGALGLG